MAKSSKLPLLKARRRYWEKELLKVIPSMAQITLSRTYRACGNPKCKRCREQGGKHGPFLNLNYREGGKTKGFYAPVKLEYLAEAAHRDWLRFREIGSKIGAINRTILELRMKRRKGDWRG